MLGERARLGGFAVPGRISAGGGCRLIAARDGWIALNLAREDDRDLLPALLEQAIAPDDDAALERAIAKRDAAGLTARGREMGLAIAALDETPASAAVERLGPGAQVAPPRRPPLVIDLAALWAGPLCGHLLRLAGAEVIKLENPHRPDRMREGEPGFFALLNQGKSNVALDPALNADRTALLALLARADIVIEAARPRGLAQLGIDAAALAAQRPGLVWLTITGHGAQGEAAGWTGFGDDCAVAGGLSAALHDASGRIGFVGDAPADPLTGIIAAHEAWRAWHSGTGGRIGLAMSAIAATALTEERTFDPALLHAELAEWGTATGQPFPAAPMREPSAPVRPLGADNARWLG